MKDNINITARITDRPSTVLDVEHSAHAGSVDAVIYMNSNEVAEVTLIPHPVSGELDTWGDPDHWISDPSVLGEDPADMASEIVAAVREVS